MNNIYNTPFTLYGLFILFLSGFILFIIGLLILRTQIINYGLYNFYLNLGFTLFTEGVLIMFYIFYLVIRHNIKVKNER